MSPKTRPAMTHGAKIRLMRRLSAVIKPRFALNGIFAMFKTKKNHAPVATSRSFGKETARRYRAMTGPAAFASIVVMPPRMPIDHANGLVWGMVTKTFGRHIRRSCPQQSRMMMTPISGLKVASSSRPSRLQPMTTPINAGGRRRSTYGYKFEWMPDHG